MATNPSELWQRPTSPWGAGSNSAASSYPTSTITPVSGQIIVAAVASLKATTPDTPTVSGTNGFNGTWTQVGTTVTIQTPAGNFIGLSVFWTLASSGVAGVVTFAFGGNNQLAMLYDLVTSPFVNTTTPVVQSKTATDTSAATTLSVTLNSALAAGPNMVLAWFAQNANATPALTAPGTQYGASLGASTTQETAGLGMRGVIGTTTTATMQTLTASVAKAAFVLELAQDGTSFGQGGVKLPLMML